MDYFAQARELGINGAEAAEFVERLQERDERQQQREDAKLQREEDERQRVWQSQENENQRQEAERQAERDERQQESQSQENERQRESQSQENENQRQEAERQRQHVIELAQLNGQGTEAENPRVSMRQNKDMIPPKFDEESDSIDSYLQRFERLATVNKWKKEEYAAKLSALLTGKALDVYARLPDDQATDYERLKKDLLRRYNKTADGYRSQFRKCRPEKEETSDQYLHRLKRYLERWIDLEDIEKSYEKIRDLMLKEQFLEACPKDVAIYLQERAPENLQELTKQADLYLIAHGRQLNGAPQGSVETKKSSTTAPSKSSDIPIKCYNCNKTGHMARECRSKVQPQMQPQTQQQASQARTWQPRSNSQQYNNAEPPWRNTRTCFVCHKTGHRASECRYRNTNTAASGYLQEVQSYTNSEEVNKEQVGAGLLTCNKVNGSEPSIATEKILKNISNNKLALANGENVDVVTNTEIRNQKTKNNMPVVDGKIGNQKVRTLRDSGCSGVVVKQKFVKEEELTGKKGYMVLVDNTLREAPMAKIKVDTPYLTGEVEALCLPDALYDLIIGNINRTP